MTCLKDMWSDADYVRNEQATYDKACDDLLITRGEPTGVIKPQRGVPRDGRKIVTKAEREHTPPAFAAWLVELAKRCAA